MTWPTAADEGLARSRISDADDMSDVILQRIVVKVGLSRDLASALLADIRGEVEFLEALSNSAPRPGGSGSHFHH